MNNVKHKCSHILVRKILIIDLIRTIAIVIIIINTTFRSLHKFNGNLVKYIIIIYCQKLQLYLLLKPNKKICVFLKIRVGR